MGYLLSVLRFPRKHWLFIVPPALIAIHILAVIYIPMNKHLINKILSTLTQMVGGVLIILSINGNIITISDKTLLQVIGSRLKELFNFKQHTTTIITRPGTIKITGYPCKIRTYGPSNTVDEKIAFIQQQINWLKEDHNEEAEHLKNKIIGVEKRKDEEISALRRSIGDIDHKVKEISVGGIDQQIFGVYLILHGSIAGFFS